MTIRENPRLLCRNLALRSRLSAAVRTFFLDRGYVEVETPVRIPAPVPEAHIEPVPADGWVLQTSPEVCMKRLLALGMPRIFQMARCFRKNERGRRHLPEMSLLEWYSAGMDYRDVMEETAELVRHAAAALGVGDTLVYGEKKVRLDGSFDRITVSEAFARHGSMSMEAAVSSDRFDEIMGLEIEPELGNHRPVFIHDYPARHGALARLKPENPSLAERFELYVGGMEICNAFSELVDPEIQRRRFEDEQALRASLNKPVYPLPEPFLHDLAKTPPAAGCALGMDRLAMLFANAPDIAHVSAFTPEDL